MTSKTRRVSFLIIRIILGLIFLISGIGKLINGSDARYLVELMATKYYWLIEYTSSIVITVSIIELLLSLLLFWGKRIALTLAASLLLLLIFSSILTYFYVQGMNVASCGCFGAFGIGGGLVFSLIKNVVLTGLIITAYVLMPSGEKK